MNKKSAKSTASLIRTIAVLYLFVGVLGSVVCVLTLPLEFGVRVALVGFVWTIVSGTAIRVVGEILATLVRIEENIGPKPPANRIVRSAGAKQHEHTKAGVPY